MVYTHNIQGRCDGTRCQQTMLVKFPWPTPPPCIMPMTSCDIIGMIQLCPLYIPGPLFFMSCRGGWVVGVGWGHVGVGWVVGVGHVGVWVVMWVTYKINWLNNFICHLSFLKKLSSTHTHPPISICEFLKPYELLFLEFESFIKGWMLIEKIFTQ